jgi:Ca2+-binding EF-hand superfamily protein
VKAVEETLEDTLSNSKSASAFTERTFLDAVRALGIMLSECEIRAIFALIDTEKKGAITVDDVMDFALKGKNPHNRRAREGPQ